MPILLNFHSIIEFINHLNITWEVLSKSFHMHIAHAFDPLPTVNTRNIFAFLMELNHIFEHTPLFLEDKIFILVQIKYKEDINYYFIFLS